MLETCTAIVTVFRRGRQIVAAETETIGHDQNNIFNFIETSKFDYTCGKPSTVYLLVT